MFPQVDLTLKHNGAKMAMSASRQSKADAASLVGASILEKKIASSDRNKTVLFVAFRAGASD